MGEASTQRRRERGSPGRTPSGAAPRPSWTPQLTPDQKDRLDQLRRQCQETGEYAAVVAFQNGLYTGFQQYFQRDTSDTPYQDFLHGTLLQYTSPKRKTLFRARLEDDQAQADALTQCLPEDLRPPALTQCCDAWEDQLWNFLRYGFYLGYRFALDTLDTANGAGASHRLVKKTLLTEFDLSLLLPLTLLDPKHPHPPAGLPPGRLGCPRRHPRRPQRRRPRLTRPPAKSPRAESSSVRGACFPIVLILSRGCPGAAPSGQGVQPDVGVPGWCCSSAGCPAPPGCCHPAT